MSTKSKAKKSHVTAFTEPNWLLIIIGFIFILLNVALVVTALILHQDLGWAWTTILCITGILSITLGIITLIKNEPAWILLDLTLRN